VSKIYKRSFLNPLSREGTACIQMRFQKVKETEYDAEVVLADCSRQVTLDFAFWTPQMRRERLVKVNTLLAYFTELKANIESAELKKY
jgi:hypothetical protein